MHADTVPILAGLHQTTSVLLAGTEVLQQIMLCLNLSSLVHSMFLGLHGHLGPGSVRLRHSLRIWDLQPEDQRRLAGSCSKC